MHGKSICRQTRYADICMQVNGLRNYRVANSADPDQTAPKEQSDLGLH